MMTKCYALLSVSTLQHMLKVKISLELIQLHALHRVFLYIYGHFVLSEALFFV